MSLIVYLSTMVWIQFLPRVHVLEVLVLSMEMGIKAMLFSTGRPSCKPLGCWSHAPRKHQWGSWVTVLQGSVEGCYQSELGSTQISLASWHVITFCQMSSDIIAWCSQEDLHQNWASEMPCLLPVRYQTYKQNKSIFFTKLWCLRCLIVRQEPEA